MPIQVALCDNVTFVEPFLISLMETQRNSFVPLFAFWKECVRHPLAIGALFPSGLALGRAIAAEVLKYNPGVVIELGAGTGAITQSLIQIRHRMQSLCVIEKSSVLASVLRQRFAGLDVRNGCATMLRDMWIPGDSPLTLVSSIPFKSLPQSDVDSIAAAIAEVGNRSKNFRLIQYSYFVSAPFPAPAAYEWRRGKMVLSNFPPATVWVLERSKALSAGLGRN